jgi:hypothetical protein
MDRRKADALLELVASGETLSEACRHPNMPSRSTTYAWLDADEEFAQRFERALERGGDAIADYAHHLATNTTRENAAANRIILDALKWRAARLNSRYAAPAIADAAADDGSAAVDIATVRAKLFDKLDAVAERIEAAEQERFFASRLIASAVRELEGQRRLDPTDEDDRKAILATVQQVIAPKFVPLPEAVLDVPVEDAAEAAE